MQRGFGFLRSEACDCWGKSEMAAKRRYVGVRVPSADKGTWIISVECNGMCTVVKGVSQFESMEAPLNKNCVFSLTNSTHLLKHSQQPILVGVAAACDELRGVPR